MDLSIARVGGGFVLESSIKLDAPLDDVFPFFSNAQNLETLTPAHLRFRILTTTPIEMREGVLIDYSIKLHGLPMRWRSLISSWDPPHGFTDEQVRGPYSKWVHLHSFEPDGKTTIARDRVEYGVPGGGLAHSLFVKGNLRKIFAYRHQKMGERFGVA